MHVKVKNTIKNRPFVWLLEAEAKPLVRRHLLREFVIKKVK